MNFIVLAIGVILTIAAIVNSGNAEVSKLGLGSLAGFWIGAELIERSIKLASNDMLGRLLAMILGTVVFLAVFIKNAQFAPVLFSVAPVIIFVEIGLAIVFTSIVMTVVMFYFTTKKTPI